MSLNFQNNEANKKRTTLYTKKKTKQDPKVEKSSKKVGKDKKRKKYQG